MAFEQPDYDTILGLGSKKKKAEKKVKKAEKQLAKGNIKVAERKLTKAVKKLSQTANPNESPTKQRIIDTQAKVAAAKQQKETLLQDTTPTQPVTGTGELMPLDPVTSQDSTAILGSGSLVPKQEQSATGGGGGDFSEFQQLEQPFESDIEQDEVETDENGNPVTSPNIKIFLIVAAVAVAFYFLTRKK